MKLVYALAAIALALSACQPQSDSQTPLATDSPGSSNQQAAKEGAFVAQAHPTSGNARIVTEKGQKFLELDSAFKSDSGPDLFVILHRSLPPQDYDSKNYVNLGKLQKTNGAQKYSIPADVNPADFSSVAIWCRQFNVTFGYAALPK